MDGRSLKEALTGGRPVVGTMVTDWTGPAIAPILTAAGFDFLVVDMEHGPSTLESFTALAMAARGAGIAPIVRITWHARDHVQRSLDAGAAGVLAPGVESREMTEQIVRWARYAPEGERGVALRRAHSDYRKVDAAAYMADANASTLVLAQIESGRGVDRIEDICGVPGLDGLLLGTNDLAQSLGVVGQTTHASVVKAIERVLQVGLSKGLPVGIHLGDVSSLRRWIAAGMRWVMLGSEVTLLADAAAVQVHELRAAFRTQGT